MDGSGAVSGETPTAAGGHDGRAGGRPRKPSTRSWGLGLGAGAWGNASSLDIQVELCPSGLCAEMREASGHGEDGLSVQGRAGGGAWAAGVGAEFLKLSESEY